MSMHTNPLDYVRIASPCPASWERMAGDERIRFCDRCELNVYNLSGMTRREAEALIVNAEGRVCVRFYRRADGTILTKNCPVGLRAVKRRATRIAASVFSAVLGFFAGLGLNFELSPRQQHTLGEMIAVPENETGSVGIMSAPASSAAPLAVPDNQPTAEKGQLLMPEPGKITPDDMVEERGGYIPSSTRDVKGQKRGRLKWSR